MIYVECFNQSNRNIRNMNFESIKTKKIGLGGTLHLVLAILILLWLNMGIASYITNSISDAYKYLIFALWLVIACSNKEYLKDILKFIIPFFGMYVIILISGQQSTNAYLAQLIKNSEYALVVITIGWFYLRSDKRKERRVILFILASDLIYIFINTLIQLQFNPYLSRYLSTGETVRPAIGNYAVSYGLVMIALVMFYALLNENKKKIIYASIYILCIVFILQAQFVLAFLFIVTFTGIVLVISLMKKVNIGVKTVLLLTILLGATTLFLNADNLLRSLVRWDVLPNELKIKLIEISYLFEGVDLKGTDMLARYSLYSTSMETFISNIFIGSFGMGGIGAHATFLDMMGLYGLLSLPYFWFYVNVYREYKKRMSLKDALIYNIVWVYFIILGFVNTIIWSNIAICLFIMTPYIMLYLQESRIMIEQNRLAIIKNKKTGDEYNESFMAV